MQYVVCLKCDYIRDAEVFTRPESYDELDESGELCTEIYEDDNWSDISPNVFLDIVKADSQYTAIKQTAEKTGYSEKHMFAIQIK